MNRSVAFVLLCLSACTGSDMQARIRIAAVDQALSGAAAQIRHCYHVPRVPAAGRSIVTRLRVRYDAAGALAGPPILIWQDGVTESNRAYAGEMAEAARAAVVSCSPIRLPADLRRDGWDDFILDFSYSVRV